MRFFLLSSLLLFILISMVNAIDDFIGFDEAGNVFVIHPNEELCTKARSKKLKITTGTRYFLCTGYYTLLAVPKNKYPKNGRICIQKEEYPRQKANIYWKNGTENRYVEVEVHAYDKDQLKMANQYIKDLTARANYKYILASPNKNTCI